MYLNSDKYLTVNLTLRNYFIYCYDRIETLITTSLKDRLLDRVPSLMDCDAGIYTRSLYSNCPLRMHSSLPVLVMGLCSPEIDALAQN